MSAEPITTAKTKLRGQIKAVNAQHQADREQAAHHRAALHDELRRGGLDKGLEWLLAQQHREHHPLERFLWERGVSQETAAAALGISPRCLKDRIARRHRPRDPQWWASVEAALGIAEALAEDIGVGMQRGAPVSTNQDHVVALENKVARLTGELADARSELKELRAELKAAHDRVHGLQAALRTVNHMYSRRTRATPEDFCRVHGGSRNRCSCDPSAQLELRHRKSRP